MQPKFFYILALLALLSFGFAKFQSIKKISVSMNTRSTRSGKTAMLKAEIGYATSGTMISHFTVPNEQYIINTSKGEVSLYDPAKNTVAQQVNYLFSTETTQFYYFLNNQKSDLGLRKMGFVNKKTRFENALMITTWTAPARVAQQIKEIELVLNGTNPIYAKYIGGKGEIIKKVYYANYTNLSGTDFPQTITQIEYFSTILLRSRVIRQWMSRGSSKSGL